MNVYPGLLLRITGGQRTTAALVVTPDGLFLYALRI